MYLGAGVVEVTGDKSGVQPNAEDFADFSDGAFFGAFALDPVSGAFGWVTGFHDIARARETAVAMCEDWGGRCAIYAEIRPEDYDPDRVGLTLSADLGAYLYRNLSDIGSPATIALSTDGAWAAPSTDLTGQALTDDLIARCGVHIDTWAPEVHKGPVHCRVAIGPVLVFGTDDGSVYGSVF